ncbi:Putrescine oxidase [Pirellula sp. SH-Sr6A]|uniref:flavin monoamine oxidase family protein n=1 Tax=Pirellula sp. SH-Sr6A TaxID=1632865 RepID=UPI00078B6289|nr:NAD(P)/FAD-dependent oxidoreductase [Pirellula sp. SH-Sr6A]AMV33528.1 Putrescine oxidase [Pirellula sp. SH-Sr6A]
MVGAGFSGLACAYELASAGYNVKVFEARRRVGGRVLSLKNLIPGKNVEGGGELLGSNHPHILAYAAKFGFEFLDIQDEDAAFPMILEGRKLPDEEARRIEAECDSAYSQMTKEALEIDAEEPWKSIDAAKLDRRTTADWIADLPVSDLAKRLLTLQFTSDNGVSASRQSHLCNLAQVKGGGLDRYWTDTELYRLDGGNQSYAHRLAEELGDQRLRLDCPIREIQIHKQHVTIVDAGGERHEADDVVLATPPSTWSSIRFTPELPETLLPQMGANVKFLSVVREPFWRAAGLSPDATSDGEIAQTWHGTDGQDETGSVALVAFSGGPGAEALHRRAAAERQPAYVKELELLFPGYTKCFMKGQFMDWIADPWTRAGYSFPAPGEITTLGPVLHQGIGRLHFAGEHCCYQFVGYMEGALHSGASLAKRIARRDGVEAD